MRRALAVMVLGILAVMVLGMLGGGPALAEDVSINAVIEPSVVPVGSEATLVVTVQGKFRRSSQPEIPVLDEFAVYQSGTSQSFSIVNGRRSSSLKFTYVLVPRKEGLYKIEPIRFTVGGKVYTAEPVTVEVVKSSTQLPLPGSGDDEPEYSGEDAHIFIRAKVDRDTVYVNQQVTWTLGFYTDGKVELSKSPYYSAPPAEGFWAEDLPPQKNYYKTINNRKYLVNEIKRGFFPTVPGTYTIGSARVDIVIDDVTSRSFDDFFRRPFSSFGFGDPRSLSTDKIPIVVLRLPARGKPADFSGLVGRGLTIQVRVDKQVVQAGEPINLTLEISGQGNFKTMAAPTVPQMDGFKMYESGSNSDLFKRNYVVAGRKQSKFVLVPRDAGNTVIPPVRLSYFDPIERAYKSIQSAPISMEIKPAEAEQGGRRIIFAGSGEDIQVLGKDINFIHPVPAVLATGTSRFYRSGLFVALHLFPLLAVFVSLAVERRRRRWRDDVSFARSSRAAREASKKLKKASEMEKKDRHEEACAIVSTALREYIADKMNQAASGLTLQDIEGYLVDCGAGAEEQEQLAAVLRTCDGVQYSPSAVGASGTAETIREALDVVRRLEERYLS
ncbi:MAG: BatD family protein [Candidatus Krumholzibacteria bacterium]